MKAKNIAATKSTISPTSDFFESIKLVPIIAIVAITPLIVYLAIIQIPEAYQGWWKGPQNSDFFSYYKAQWLKFWILPCAASLGFALYKYRQEMRSWFVYNRGILILVSIFAATVVASAALSAVPWIAWNGFFDRYEGGWVWLSYCVLCLACAFLMRNKDDFRHFYLALAVSVGIVALIGVFQFFGLDFFRSGLGRALIVPMDMASIRDSLNFRFGPWTIYSTFYNTNYGGSIAALVFPIFATLFLYSAGKRRTIFWLILAMLVFVLAVGCNSQAGNVGLLLSFFFLLVFLLLRDRSKLKRLLILLLFAAVIFSGMDFASGHRMSVEISKVVGLALKPAPSSIVDDVASTGEGTLESLPSPQSKADRLILKYGAVGSGRGYIYIRTIDYILRTRSPFGSGPDGYAVFFRQDDPFRVIGGFTESLIIDKPHSMFLQIPFNTGLVSFVAFMLLILLHFGKSLKLYYFQKSLSPISSAGIALFLGWLGFLGASLFNDSSLSVSPLFWAVFGASAAANYQIWRDNLICGTASSKSDVKAPLVALSEHGATKKRKNNTI
jgi:hypothetical protein